MSFTPNPNFNVEAFLSKKALPIFENDLGVTRTMNPEYADYADNQRDGIEGATALVRLPTRLRNLDTLAFNTTTSGNFVQRQFSISVTEQKANPIQVQNVEEALYSKQSIITDNAVTQIVEMANSVEKYNIGVIQNTGYRFFGDPSAASGQLQSVAETDLAVNKFQSFGMPANSEIQYVVPYTASSTILQTAYQQFVTKRNNELSLRGEIGYLDGVDRTLFMKSNFLNVHTAGTASNFATNLTTGYTITSVTPNPDYGSLTSTNITESSNTSTIVLEGMNPGDTVVVNDMLDIGFFNDADNPLRFFTQSGYQPSSNSVQARVVTGGTVDGLGALTIVVQPALIFDPLNINPFQNINRPIITGGGAGADTIRFCKSHRAGLMYFGKRMYFLNPKLSNTDPFPSASIRSKAGFSMRAYHGHIMGQASNIFTYDMFFGSGGDPAAAARLIFPLDT